MIIVILKTRIRFLLIEYFSTYSEHSLPYHPDSCDMKSSFILTAAVCAAIPWLTNALTRGPEFVRINKTDAVRFSLPP